MTKEERELLIQVAAQQSVIIEAIAEILAAVKNGNDSTNEEDRLNARVDKQTIAINLRVN